ncbi:MAG: HD domain-containing phosphohydrolase [Planctomycetaceae bacterium]
MTTTKVLCVDDDAKILNGIRRQLGGQFDLETAEGPLAAQQLLEQSGPYAVVVSDMRMPEMTGIELLKLIRKTYPDTVRIMLTGESDLNTTINAVNEGNIFRFLSKPCGAEILGTAISDGLRQYQLVTAERELVEGTLKGSVKLLSEMLSLVSPASFGRAARVQRMATKVGEKLGTANLWELEIAALLSPLGCVTVPDAIVEKVSRGERLSAAESEAYETHPRFASKLLKNIPRLESVAQTIEYQSQSFDGTGFPGDGVRGEQIPLGARILKAIFDLDTEMLRCANANEAFQLVKGRGHLYDPQVLRALEPIVKLDSDQQSLSVTVARLVEGMVFVAPVMSMRGQTLVAKGQQVSASLKMKLLNYAGQIQEPLVVSYFQS